VILGESPSGALCDGTGVVAVLGFFRLVLNEADAKGRQLVNKDEIFFMGVAAVSSPPSVEGDTERSVRAGVGAYVTPGEDSHTHAKPRTEIPNPRARRSADSVS
jgi:hypothetical protein